MSSLARRLTRAKRRERLTLRRDRNCVVLNFNGEMRAVDLTPTAPPPSIEAAFQGLEEALAEVDCAGKALGLSGKSLRKIKEAILAVGLDGVDHD